MGFTVIPKNIGGVSVNSALGPLAELFRNDKIDNLVFPSDLGSNPAMGHAVVFQAYDRTTKIQQSAQEIPQVYNKYVEEGIKKTQNAFNKGSPIDSLTDVATGVGNVAFAPLAGFGQGLKTFGSLFTAPAYATEKKPGALSTISLFMPESVTVDYNSNYGDVSMTDLLGAPGIIGNAISDYMEVGLKNMVTPYATAGVGKLFETVVPGIKSGAGQAVTQAFGVVSNPQMQLLYHGISLRSFQLEFILTPKSASEAKKVKQICDSFVFYSLPNIAGGQIGTSGQFLNPPQLFSIQFRFLGRNDIVGNISNVISSALTNSGLGFFTSGSKINNGTEAKLFTVKDCVLEDVSIDYTPNGFATYNDGYPVQTKISLRFKETQMVTKEHFRGTEISSNYASRTTNSYTNQSDEHAAFARSLGDSTV